MSLLFIDTWFDNAFIKALGWTLFHSLWQGFLLVVLVSLTIFLTKRSTATIRYRIFSTLFFLFLGTTLITFIIEYSSLRPIPVQALLTGNEIGDTLTLSSSPHTAAVDLKVPLPGRLAFYFNLYGPWLMLLWFIVFLLKSIRLGINYAQVQRIRNENPYFLPDIEKRVNELAKMLRIKRTVKLRETTSITVPVTIGFLKPLILIPCGLINNLPPDQVEAILLHELAHIRRKDYLVNLIQCLAETVFFFNPAVLWLSSLLREERENCCDDIAITVTRDKSLFIHALVAFQEYHAGHPMAPGLTGSKYPLLKRIQRIVYNTNKKLNHMEKIFLALGLVVTGIVALAFNSPTTHKEKAAQSKVSLQLNAGTVIRDSIPANNSRNAQKRSEEALLLEKIVDEKNKLDKTNEQERQLLEEKVKGVNKDDAKEMELLNQIKKMDLQDKFMKELQHDKVLQDLLKDKVTMNTEEELFKKLMQDAEALKLFKNLNGVFKKEYNFLDEKDRQFMLKDKLEWEMNFKELLGKMDDTTKPRKAARPKNPDDKGDDFESRQEYIKERKKELENELREKEKEDKESYNERMKEMAAYRALLQKELRQTESRIEKTKNEAEKARKEQKEYRDKLERKSQEERNKMEEKRKENQRKQEAKRREDDRKRQDERRREEQRKREEDRKSDDNRRDDDGKDDDEKENDGKPRKSEVRGDKTSTSSNSNSNENINIDEKDGKEKMDVKISEKKTFNSNDNFLQNKDARIDFKPQSPDPPKTRTPQKSAADRNTSIISDLKEDGIISKDAAAVNIHITDDEMTVNGVKQPENVFNRYKSKFRKDPTKITSPKPVNKPVVKVTGLQLKMPKIKVQI